LNLRWWSYKLWCNWSFVQFRPVVTRNSCKRSYSWPSSQHLLRSNNSIFFSESIERGISCCDRRVCDFDAEAAAVLQIMSFSRLFRRHLRHQPSNLVTSRKRRHTTTRRRAFCTNAMQKMSLAAARDSNLPISPRPRRRGYFCHAAAHYFAVAWAAKCVYFGAEKWMARTVIDLLQLEGSSRRHHLVVAACAHSAIIIRHLDARSSFSGQLACNKQCSAWFQLNACNYEFKSVSCAGESLCAKQHVFTVFAARLELLLTDLVEFCLSAMRVNLRLYLVCQSAFAPQCQPVSFRSLISLGTEVLNQVHRVVLQKNMYKNKVLWE